jgi:SAM-dependent methyltransferase
VTERQPQGSALEATGERLVPELQHGELVHAEHLARYQLAAELADSRRVLDAACGEGYGTALLAAGGALSATGIDSDEQTVRNARAKYPGAAFELGDVHRLPFVDGAFDLLVSFETIEHVRDADAVLDEFQRVLSDDGVLLISTPNKHRYLVENEFHEREFFHEEFVDLLSARFANVEVLLQHNWLASAVLSAELASDAAGTQTPDARFAKLQSIRPGGELYTVALCGEGRIPSCPPVVVAAGLDEAHELARRTVAAERTAEQWHGEYEAARRVAEGWRTEYQTEHQQVLGVYDSVWWRMTAPLRWLADRARRRRG